MGLAYFTLPRLWGVVYVCSLFVEAVSLMYEVEALIDQHLGPKVLMHGGFMFISSLRTLNPGCHKSYIGQGFCIRHKTTWIYINWRTYNPNRT